MRIDHNELDRFFIQDLMSKLDREKIQILDLKLLDIFIGLVSQNLNLSYRDAHVLAFSMGNHSIAAFTDTLFRVNKGRQNGQAQKSSHSFLVASYFEEFYLNRKCHISNSRKLRCQIANAIFQTKELPFLFDIPRIEEFKECSLEKLNIRACEEERFWKKSFFWKYRVWDGVTSVFSILRCQFINLFRPQKLRVGHTKLRLKYFLQIPGIRYIDLNPLRSESLNSIECREDRYAFFEKFRSCFVQEALSGNEWTDLFGEEKAEELLNILFALLSTQTPGYLFNSSKLAQEVETLTSNLESLNLDVIVSLGGWTNPLLPVAAHKLGLKVGVYQHGGRDLYSPGAGFENERLCINDFFLSWGWTEGEKPKSKTVFHKVSDPALEKLNIRGRKTRRNVETFRILYSPVASSVLFNIEHCRSFTPEFMPEHRKRVKDIFEELDRRVQKEKIELFVKLKGFDAHFFQNHEYMFYPKLDLKNINVRYILSGYTSDYFEHFDLHFIDGMSTTFEESMAFNLPTTVFCNNNVLELRSEFSELISEMERHRIIAYDNQAVVDNILHAIKNRTWWNEKEVQDTRNGYVKEFSRHEQNWREGIRQALLLNARKQNERKK